MTSSTSAEQPKLPKPVVNVMLDLETLGTKPGCKILSIGAVTFNDNLYDKGFIPSAFDMKLNVAAQTRLTVDQDTEDWWARQSPEARAFAFGGTVYSQDAFLAFSKWIHEDVTERGAKTVMFWCKGAEFDCPILAKAMDAYGYLPPWTFRQVSCFRTLENLGKAIAIPAPEFVGVKHSAIADAVHQAKYAQLILHWMLEGRRELVQPEDFKAHWKED